MTLQDKYKVLIDTIQQARGRDHPELTAKYVKTFQTYVPQNQYPKILDIGVGEGPQEVKQLREAGYDVYSINIQLGRTMGDDKSVIGDMNDQQFAPNSFDGAYSTQVIEHGYIPWLTFMETWVTLRPAGRLYFNVPHHNAHQTIMHPTLLSLNRWKTVLTQIGFEIIVGKETDIVDGELIFEFVAQKQIPENKAVATALEKLTEMRVKNDCV